jgi:hypothetical protein
MMRSIAKKVTSGWATTRPQFDSFSSKKPARIESVRAIIHFDGTANGRMAAEILEGAWREI